MIAPSILMDLNIKAQLYLSDASTLDLAALYQYKIPPNIKMLI